MRSKVMILMALVAMIGSVLSGCGQPEPGQSGPNGGEGQGDVAIQLIATEKVLPADFYDRAEQGVLATKVTDQAAFESQWTYYGLEGTPSEREWADEAVIFLGVIESGSCPYEIETLQFNEEQTELAVRLKIETEMELKTDLAVVCTDDATPRTFVFAVYADQIAETEWVVLENFGGLTPKVELQTVEDNEKATAGQALPGSEPPAAFIEVNGKRHETVLGTYCWSGEKEGICVDTAGPVQLLEGKEPVEVQPGETIRLMIEGKPQPSDMELILVQDDQHIPIEVKDDQFTAPQEKGVYYYSLGAWWKAEENPDVSLGDAFYAFVIKVI